MLKILANSTLLLGLVSAVIGLLVAFHVNLTDAETGAIMGVFSAVLLLLGAYYSPNIPGGAKDKKAP